MTDAPRIHPTAIVDPAARVDSTSHVGPYAVVGPGVRVGPGCRIEAHVVLEGDTVLGRNNRIGPHAVVGGAPQIREVADTEWGGLRIGDENRFREFVSVHCGGGPGRFTAVGSRCLLMAGSHVAHDCRIGDGVELANGVQLAGHVVVEDLAVLGGLAAVHQFVRVGRLAFVGAGSMVSQDVPPFALANGDRARVYDLNVVGLKRLGFPASRRRLLRRALRRLLAAPTMREGLERVAELDQCDEVEQLIGFARASRRGVCRLSRGVSP